LQVATIVQLQRYTSDQTSRAEPHFEFYKPRSRNAAFSSRILSPRDAVQWLQLSVILCTGDKMLKPEILAPAGNLERLKVAVLYGADAVYVGGQKYGLRARADNFTDVELERGVLFAHQRGAKVFITLNAFLHDEDFEGLPEYCKFLESIEVDAIIASDLGVIRCIKKHSNLRIHLSTQQSCLNALSALVWKSLGVSRIVVGREVSIKEAGEMIETTGLEIEMFAHGALCMAYSGNCTISNYTAGRDSNRGGCIHSCRFDYGQTLDDATSNTALRVLNTNEASTVHSSFMSSKDLMGLDQIPDFLQFGIHSLKIEGRMKSAFYVATACRVYRRIVDAYADGSLTEELLLTARTELSAVPNRGFISGSLEKPAGEDSVDTRGDATSSGTHKYQGMVIESDSEKIVLRLFAPLSVGDTIDLLAHNSDTIHHRVEELTFLTGKRVSNAKQENVVCIPKTENLKSVAPLTIVRSRNLEVSHEV